MGANNSLHFAMKWNITIEKKIFFYYWIGDWFFSHRCQRFASPPLLIFFILNRIAWQFKFSVVLEYSEWSFPISRLLFNKIRIPAQQIIWFLLFMIMSFTPLLSRISKLMIWSRNDFPIVDMSIAVNSICSSFFMVAHVLLLYSIAGKTVLLKILACSIFSILALHTSFIVVN